MTGYPILRYGRMCGRYVFILHRHLGRTYTERQTALTGVPWTLAGITQIPPRGRVLTGFEPDGEPRFEILEDLERLAERRAPTSGPPTLERLK